MSDSDARLRALLGGDPPESVRTLDAERRDALAALVADARQRQGRALEVALTAAVQHVPFPVRGVVKKVLFG